MIVGFVCCTFRCRYHGIKQVGSPLRCPSCSGTELRYEYAPKPVAVAAR